MHLWIAQLAGTGSACCNPGVKRVPPCLPRPAWLLALLSAALAVAAAWAVPGPGTRDAPAPPWTALRIGVAAPAMPLASPTRNYTEEGHELALARALGERLGAAPQFVALAPEDFAQALADGRVDAVLTRQSPPAQPGVQVLRSGYRSGTAAAMRSDTRLRRWDDLRGRTVCVSHANLAAQALAQRHGARIRLLDAPAQALVEVRTGACDAALHDQAQLQALFERKEWHKFSATLPPAEPGELLLLAARDRPQALAALQQALAGERQPQAWRARNERWAANVAFEVYFDQIGPDCH